MCPVKAGPRCFPVLVAGSGDRRDGWGRTMLTEGRYVQNIGRFEKASSIANAGVGHCTLLFGENSWGKSTLADILRSLTTGGNPAIVAGRKTLAGGPEQKVVLRIGGQQTVFENGAWTGPTPRTCDGDRLLIEKIA